MIRVDVKPEMLRWARERAGDREPTLADRFPKLPLWERGQERPTLKQLETFAKAAHVSIGYLFLSEPPEEKAPIPDLRTVGGRGVRQPSPDLLDTIYLCQQRQGWYQDYARSMHDEPLTFVGSAKVTDAPEDVAGEVRERLGFGVEERRACPTWTHALRRFVERADELGVMVMVSSVVGNNTTRKLDPDEFRGFALADPLAPLVFINGADTRAAQMFTLAHELAHIWIAQSAVSDAQASALPEQDVERWCNQVAAELLVPLGALRAEYDRRAELRGEVNRLARFFKVSTLVILRRIHDARGLTREQLGAAYAAELKHLSSIAKGQGGNFYLALASRVSKRLARALTVSTLEGRTSFTEAFRLLGLKKMATFHELASSLGIPV